MNKIILLIISTLIMVCAISNAQTIVASKATSNTVSIAVRDSASTDPIWGAVVTVYDKKDSLINLTDANGQVSIDRFKIKSDSITIKVRQMGYFEKTLREPLAKSGTTYFTVLLKEDPTTLNEIIIKADAVAMVMRGDTTVFNSAAFKTMEGDVLRKMLEQFPGVKIEGDNVMFNGQKINRILLNGKNMFGKDIGNAMDMILSKEVKSIKIYNMDSVEDLAKNKTEAKERVIDVQTWNPIKNISEINNTLQAGIINGNQSEFNERNSFKESLKLGYYSLSKMPRITADFLAQNNSSESSSPLRHYSGAISIAKEFTQKGGYSANLSFNSQKGKSHSEESIVHSALSAWPDRKDSTMKDERNNGKNLNLTGRAYRISGKNIFEVSGVASYSDEDTFNRNLATIDNNGEITGYDRIRSNNQTGASVTLHAGYTRKFAKRKRTLKVQPSISFASAKGNGLSIDTTTYTISREWLVRDKQSSSLDPAINISWTEPLAKNTQLDLSTKWSYRQVDMQDLNTDMQSGRLDLNRTQDFLQKNLKQTVSGKIKYGRLNDGFFISSGISLVRNAMNVNERESLMKDWSKDYIIPAATLIIGYTKKSFNLHAEYVEEDNMPTLYQLRNVLDYANPLYLSAGNNDLKMPVKRTLDLRAGLSFPKNAMSLVMSLNAGFHSNKIVQQTVYYQEREYLEEYGYYAEKGSCLARPVNISGAYNLVSAINLDKYFSSIHSDLSLTLDYNRSSEPFFIETDRHTELNDTYSLLCMFKMNSEKHQLMFIPELSYVEDALDGELSYSSLSPSLSAEYTQRIGEHFEFNGHLSAYASFTNEKDLNYSNLTLDSSLSWLFGKDNRCRVSVFGKNLTNSLGGWSNSVTQQFVQHVTNQYLGRQFGIGFTYIFSKR